MNCLVVKQLNSGVCNASVPASGDRVVTWRLLEGQAPLVWLGVGKRLTWGPQVGGWGGVGCDMGAARVHTVNGVNAVRWVFLVSWDFSEFFFYPRLYLLGTTREG